MPAPNDRESGNTKETNAVIICSIELRGLSTVGHGENERFNQNTGKLSFLLDSTVRSTTPFKENC